MAILVQGKLWNCNKFDNFKELNLNKNKDLHI